MFIYLSTANSSLLFQALLNPKVCLFPYYSHSLLPNFGLYRLLLLWQSHRIFCYPFLPSCSKSFWALLQFSGSSTFFVIKNLMSAGLQNNSNVWNNGKSLHRQLLRNVWRKLNLFYYKIILIWVWVLLFIVSGSWKLWLNFFLCLVLLINLLFTLFSWDLSSTNYKMYNLIFFFQPSPPNSRITVPMLCPYI